MAAPLLAEAVGGTPFLGFISAVAFATILAVVAGLTLSGAAALSHDLWVNVVRDGEAPEHEQLRGRARRDRSCSAVLAIVLGIAVQGPERRVHGRARVRDRGERELPGARAVDLLARLHDLRRGGEHGRRHHVGARPDLALADGQVDVLDHDSAIIRLKNPALISMPLAFVSGILVSLLRPEPEAAARLAEAERRIHLGDTSPPARPAGLPARAR